jgi:ribosomal protein S18 acetylase RimI-like enzyme
VDPGIQRVGSEYLDAVVEVRLRALKDAPYAFASTVDREQALGRDEWLARLERGAWWLARRDDRVVGLVAGIVDPDEPVHRQLVSMWVEPAERGGPAAARLVRAVLDWAGADGATGVVLWVAEDNERAFGFYRKMGFRSTGRRTRLPSRPEVSEEQMMRAAGPG